VVVVASSFPGSIRIPISDLRGKLRDIGCPEQTIRRHHHRGRKCDVYAAARDGNPDPRAGVVANEPDSNLVQVATEKARALDENDADCWPGC